MISTTVFTLQWRGFVVAAVILAIHFALAQHVEGEPHGHAKQVAAQVADILVVFDTQQLEVGVLSQGFSSLFITEFAY